MGVLLTGGTGFIGSHLARRLVEEGKRVVLYDNRPNYENIKDVRKDVTIAEGDVTDLSRLLHVVRKYDIKDFFHLGARLSADCEAEPVASLKSNLEGTVNVLEVARSERLGKVIFTSSAAVYGYDAKDPVGEDAPRSPTSAYGITKVFCEMWGLYYYRRYGLDFRAVRLIAVIGPHRGDGGLSAFVQHIIQKPALGEPYEVPIEESTKVAIIYYRDVVHALMLLFSARNLVTRIYNIAGIIATAGEIAAAVRRQIPSASITFKPRDDLTNFYRGVPARFDDRKARQELGWECSYELDAAVKELIKDIQTEAAPRKQ